MEKKKIGPVIWFSHREKVEYGHYEQTIFIIKEKRECQPMNDGTVKYGKWKEISRKTKKENVGYF